MQRTFLALLVALVGFVVAGVAEAQPRPGPENGRDLTQVEEVRVRLFENARPSVVRIEGAQRPPGPLGLPDPLELPGRLGPFEPPGLIGLAGAERQQTGSGVVWDTDGHVVTSHHLVEGQQTARVVLADGSTFEARLVGSDPATDLAVLQIEAPEKKLKPVQVGGSNSLRVGQDAYAIGHPFGLDATLHQGIISGLDREIRSSAGRPLSGLIQTDLAISPGDGGSPLLDRSGRLVGLNTAIFRPPGSSARIAFAIPAATLRRVVPDLIEHGEVVRPILGVVIGGGEAVRRLGLEGVLVQEVVPGGPADEAGLRPTRTGEDGQTTLGDVIVAVDGEPVKSAGDLLGIVGRHEVGDKVKLTVKRDGEEVEVPVELGAPEAE